MSATVGVILDEATPLLARIKTAAQAKGLVLVAARAAGSRTKEHLFALNAERHKFGRNYYAQAARGVSIAATGDGAAVNITQIGIRQRYYGGTILPKKKYLTIPADPEAYGKRAGEFNDLDFQLAMAPDGSIRPALVRRASTAIKLVRSRKKDGTVTKRFKATALRGGEVMFWLVRSVTQAGDTSILPESSKLSEVAVGALRSEILRVAARKTGGSSS